MIIVMLVMLQHAAAACQRNELAMLQSGLGLQNLEILQLACQALAEG